MAVGKVLTKTAREKFKKKLKREADKQRENPPYLEALRKIMK